MRPWLGALAVAFGITVPVPLGDELVRDVVHGSGSTAIAVSDSELLAELREFGRREGLLVCPEGAACLATARRLRTDGWLPATRR